MIKLIGEAHHYRVRKAIYNYVMEELLHKRPKKVVFFIEGSPSPIFEGIKRPFSSLEKLEKEMNNQLLKTSKDFTHILRKRGLSIDIEMIGMDIPPSFDPLSLWAYNPSLRLTPPEVEGKASEIVRRYILTMNEWVKGLPISLSPWKLYSPSEVYLHLWRKRHRKLPPIRATLDYRSVIFALTILQAQDNVVFAHMGNLHVPMVKHLLKSWGVMVSSKSYGVILRPRRFVVHPRDGTAIMKMTPAEYFHYLTLPVEQP